MNFQRNLLSGLASILTSVINGGITEALLFSILVESVF